MTPLERLEALAGGENPRLIARMRSGFAVLADNQYLRGYSLLLAYPMVAKLNDLVGPGRAQFLEDMATLGDAVLAASGAVRANYGIYGNLDPFLHAHVWPRFANEPDELRNKPPLTFPDALLSSAETAYDADRDHELLVRIRSQLSV